MQSLSRFAGKNQRRIYMKRIVAMVVAAMMALSFSMVAVAAEKKAFSSVSSGKKDAKKVKKDAKEKPAAKGKKELSGC